MKLGYERSRVAEFGMLPILVESASNGIREDQMSWLINFCLASDNTVNFPTM